MHQRHRRIMRRMMEEFFADPFDDRPGHCPSPFISRRHFNPECDLKEKSGSYELTLEVPGMSGSDLKITVSRGVLTVSGEKKEVRETETADCRTGERCYGAFRRSFSLPGGTDIDGIRAKCKDGVLTVIIPKPAKSPEEVKTIPVES
ncbi:Hsp20/alpha crystallin family protein [Victivallis vadensis]|nr:Hsp20/alpha crystallin family protein [Victivallis vadensis]